MHTVRQRGRCRAAWARHALRINFSTGPRSSTALALAALADQRHQVPEGRERRAVGMECLSAGTRARREGTDGPEAAGPSTDTYLSAAVHLEKAT